MSPALSYSTPSFNAQQIIDKRYSIKDEQGLPTESWNEIAKRVASHVATAEEAGMERETFFHNAFDLIRNRVFIPNTPCLVNAGKPNGQLAGCFVLPVPDSIKGIMKTASDAALIHQSGGGTGFTFEHLRPSGSLVQTTHGVASGPISFMEIFDKVTDVVKQGGVRRGANMACFAVTHPDILRFIHAKNDQHSLLNFNISVAVTDKFMEAVENNEWYQTEFNGKPYTQSVYDPIAGELDQLMIPAEQKRGMLYAPDVWNRIIASAHKWGEPGIIFIDTVNKSELMQSLGPIESCNPCQPDFAPLLTPQGIKQLKDVKIGDVIWSEDRWTTVTNKWSTGEKNVFAYHTNAGIFYGTENHRVVSEGEKIKASFAHSIDRLTGEFFQPDFVSTQAVVDGLVLGDGFPHKASNNKIVLIVGDNDQDYFEDPVTNKIGRLTSIGPKHYEVETTLTAEELPRVWDRCVPERYIYAKPSIVASLLRGLYSANGSVCDNRITLKTTSFQLMRDVQLMLSSLGIGSYYTTNKPAVITHHNGDFESKESFDLNITSDRQKFIDAIGFIQKYKSEKLRAVKGSYPRNTFDITKVEFLSTMEVFDMTVDNSSHTYWTGGLNVSNCGEQFLHSYNSCNLGSIDVSKFYSPVAVGLACRATYPAADFDWDAFREAVYWSVRFLDNVIDTCVWPLPEIDEMVKRTRPVGLGIMGFADLLLKLRIRYGSDESVEFLNQLMSSFQLNAWEASLQIGKEKGAFPEYENNKERYDNFFWDALGFDDLALYGTIGDAYNGSSAHFYPRNYEVTTVAPTGTISLVAETSSGIEPNFAWSFHRADTVGERDYVHPLAAQFYKDSIDKADLESAYLPPELPEYFVTAHDVTPMEHVKILATAQKYVDNGVSKTVNGPENDSVENVDTLYRTAYKLGVKAVSYYRDNSRVNQVLTHSSKPKCAACGAEMITVDKCNTCVSCGSGSCSL
jgi:ribonucleoside-diphosphate reductase alpha chain